MSFFKLPKLSSNPKKTSLLYRVATYLTRVLAFRPSHTIPVSTLYSQLSQIYTSTATTKLGGWYPSVRSEEDSCDRRWGSVSYYSRTLYVPFTKSIGATCASGISGWGIIESSTACKISMQLRLQKQSYQRNACTCPLWRGRVGLVNMLWLLQVNLAMKHQCCRIVGMFDVPW